MSRAKPKSAIFTTFFSSTLHNEVTERIPFSSTLDPAGRTAIEALFGSTYFDSEAGGNRITVGNQAINYYEETTNGGSAVYATPRSDIFALTALMSNESSIGTSGVLIDHPGRVTDSSSFTFQALGRTHRCQAGGRITACILMPLTGGRRRQHIRSTRRFLFYHGFIMH